jgi:carbon monoxide dehydrogenase subunit G
VKNLENDMARIESTILVDPSLEEVFAFLNAPESHARFIPNMATFQQTSPGAFGKVGASARGLLSYFGLVKIKVQYQIIEHEPNRQLAMQGQMGPVLFKDGYVLSKNGGGTEIKFWLDLLPTGWAKFLSPFMGLIGKIHAWETLRNLKRELATEKIAASGRASSSQ